MSDAVVAESTGKIFGKLRSRAEDTKPQPPAAKPVAQQPSPADRVKPGAKYGDKPGEERIDVKDMTKPLAGQMPSYKDGTDYVPKTGPAMLHKGEAVVPKKDNMVTDKITGGVPAKVVSHMVHRKHKADHHTVENHHTRPEHHPHEIHHFHGASALDQVHDHLEEHAGTPNPGEAEADAGQSGVPPAAVPGAPAPAAPAAAMGA